MSDLFLLRRLLIFGAGMVAISGEDGWGWFLFAAVIV